MNPPISTASGMPSSPPSLNPKLRRARARHAQEGWGLLETLLTLGAITALSAGIYLALHPASATAQVKAEQNNLHHLSKAVDRSFGVMGNFDGVSASKILASDLAPPKMAQAGALRTRWGSAVSIAPNTVAQPADSFIITYPATPPEVCAQLAAAVAEEAYDIRVNGQSVYAANGLSPDLAVSRCASGPSTMEFVYHSGLIAGQAVAAAPLTLPPGVPFIDPPPTPPATTPFDPAPGVDPARGVDPVVPPGVVIATPPPLPVPPVGPPGTITPPPPPSVPPLPPTPPGLSACVAPAGWVDTQTRPRDCAAGQYGRLEQSRDGVHDYTCPEAWGDPVDSFGVTGWGPWVTATDTCASCPAPATQTQRDWQARSAACPSGWTGSHTWEEQRRRTRTRSYTCPAGTTALPAPEYSDYEAWSWTGNKRNEINTCTAPAGACGDSTSVYGDGTAPASVPSLVCDAAHEGQYKYVGQSGDVTDWASYLYQCSGGTFVQKKYDDAPWSNGSYAEPYRSITKAVDLTGWDWTWPEFAKGVEKSWAAQWVCYAPAPSCATKPSAFTGKMSYRGGRGRDSEDTTSTSYSIEYSDEAFGEAGGTNPYGTFNWTATIAGKAYSGSLSCNNPSAAGDCSNSQTRIEGGVVLNIQMGVSSWYEGAEGNWYSSAHGEIYASPPAGQSWCP